MFPGVYHILFQGGQPYAGNTHRVGRFYDVAGTLPVQYLGIVIFRKCLLSDQRSANLCCTIKNRIGKSVVFHHVLFEKLRGTSSYLF